MEGQQPKQWGVTSPISEAQPTPDDLKRNDELLDCLKRQNNFETPEGSERRVKVLAHFQKVTEEFVRRAAKAKGLPPSVVDNSGGKIYTFGSYALGVYGPGSDIDTLVVAPKHINSIDFFALFPPTLKELSKPEDIQELNPVPDAYVPIIKIEYCGVSIDLLFVSLPTVSSVKDDLKLSDKTLLRGLDDSAMRSLNGTRVTEELLGSVPQVKTFRYATRAIKLWANRRGVYGAVFGFPGGVAWAIMVARICQLYPFACGATILSKFFALMIKWHWPRPVMLKSIDEGTMGLKVWNPSIYPGDKNHLMPIITPAFPSMCATHTITHSTKKTMLEEFERADGIITSIFAGTKTWNDLFARHTFFTKDHKYYLSIVAASRTKESHGTWSGWVQSRVRLLAKGIDESDAGVECARPFVKAFERTHHCSNEDQVERVVQGSLDYMVKDNGTTAPTNGDKDGDKDGGKDGDKKEDKDGDKDGDEKDDKDGDKKEVKDGDKDGEPSEPAHTIYTTTFYIGITLHESGGRQLDISYPVSEFKRTIMASTAYDENLHSIRIVHTRNFDLPADVFQPGETRPVKPTRKPKPQKTKRSFTETGLEDGRNGSSKRQNGVAAPA